LVALLSLLALPDRHRRPAPLDRPAAWPIGVAFLESLMHRLLAGFLALLIVHPALPGAQAQEVLRVPNRDEAVAFLALFTGGWRGQGEARAAFDEAFEESRCNLTAVFDPATSVLTNAGRCANTRRGVSVDGTLALLPDGTLVGGFLSRFENAELLSSTGRFLDDQFVVEATYRAEIGRRVEEVTVIISVSKPVSLPAGGNAFGMAIPAGGLAFGMIVQVRNPETQEFVDFSRMVFTAA
jgi:hypothetical protein